MVTERDIAILLALVRYYVLSRPQLQRLCFPSDISGRVTRRRLQHLVDQRLINRQQMLYVPPNGGSASTVYYPASLGCELLAAHFDDERYLATATTSPIPHHIAHWIAVSETHVAFDSAIALQDEAKIDGWINEYDVVNKEESRPEHKYRLYSLLRESPRLVCAPDAAFLLSVRGHKKVFYLEQDRATSGARQIADSKTKGYVVMNELRSHRRHFPEATIDSFTVLMVAPTPSRRDTLRKAFKGKPGDSLWRFATVADLQPEKILHEPIFHPCEGEPTAIIKK
jgi:hypothetical protein